MSDDFSSISIIESSDDLSFSIDAHTGYEFIDKSGNIVFDIQYTNYDTSIGIDNLWLITLSQSALNNNIFQISVEYDTDPDISLSDQGVVAGVKLLNNSIIDIYKRGRGGVDLNIKFRVSIGTNKDSLSLQQMS
ncbi:hypothetical protein KC669_00570 [Candidatus Dojkabacteria bacterium]|uniref:Uncharacterized protein n=1 Tax=Candidatus Dojkabacteria bacterium TaxID=2099670 RepID=A0A955LAH2_9BACT|nr:hypothetical protein [Candidatus Dojkabacteria bacterium]